MPKKKNRSKEKAAKILLDEGWTVKEVFEVLELGEKEKVVYLSPPPYVPPHDYWYYQLRPRSWSTTSTTLSSTNATWENSLDDTFALNDDGSIAQRDGATTFTMGDLAGITFIAGDPEKRQAFLDGDFDA